ncbi:MAG: hypothetical protein RL490_1846 [Pseudomonadota bacterium]
MSLLRRYPHFIAFAALTLLITAVLLPFLPPARALLIGFDSGAAVFLIALLRIFRRDRAEAMRRRAAGNEPDHHVLTGLALFIVGVVVTAVWVELARDGGRHGVALAALSLALAWTFANSLFAIHYAHVYYLRGPNGDRGGLEFPGADTTPDYWDFTYYAFVLGMTFQVSDVQITSGHMRRLALAHGLLAFFYNIGVVALSVSVVASLFG